MAEPLPKALPAEGRWLTAGKIQEKLQAGLPVELPPFADSEPAGVERLREVPAAWIMALAEQPKGVIARPIVIRNAIVTGDLTLRYVEFQADVCFTGCRFRGSVDLSFCVFSKAAVLDRSRFAKKVLFRGANTRADFEWTGTRFESDLEGPGLSIALNLWAQGAQFRRCNLQGMSVGGHAEFKDDNSKPACFCGKASFDLVRIDGGLTLTEARFFGDLGFQAATIKCFIDLSCAVFRGKVQMDGLVIEGDARFENAQFQVKKGHSEADRIRFPALRVAGQGVFDGAVFGGDVRFDQANFQADTSFESAQFRGKVRFDGASFAGVAKFGRGKALGTPAGGEPTRFLGGVNFTGAKASADVHFEDAEFRGDVSFRDAGFKMVYYRTSVTQHVPKGLRPQFPSSAPAAKLDLRGFSYDGIFVAWNEALDVLEPYDVQPYRQMERTFRTMGRDRYADKVYLKQRRRALWYDCRHPMRWLLAAGGLLYWLFARFGARPLRLAIIPLILVVYSAFVFSAAHAVTAKKDSGCVEHTLTRKEALAASLNYFLPVEVPVGACWQATRGTFSLVPLEVQVSFLFWATVLKLAGWIFVPLGVAALGGFLRRDPPK